MPREPGGQGGHRRGRADGDPGDSLYVEVRGAHRIRTLRRTGLDACFPGLPRAVPASDEARLGAR